MYSKGTLIKAGWQWDQNTHMNQRDRGARLVTAKI